MNKQSRHKKIRCSSCHQLDRRRNDGSAAGGFSPAICVFVGRYQQQRQRKKKKKKSDLERHHYRRRQKAKRLSTVTGHSPEASGNCLQLCNKRKAG